MLTTSGEPGKPDATGAGNLKALALAAAVALAPVAEPPALAGPPFLPQATSPSRPIPSRLARVSGIRRPILP